MENVIIPFIFGLIGLSIIDIKQREIPDILLILLSLSALPYIILKFNIFMIFGFLLALSLNWFLEKTNSTWGGADAKLILIIGFILGINFLYFLLFSFSLFIFILELKKEKRKDFPLFPIFTLVFCLIIA